MKDGTPEANISRKPGIYTKTLIRASFANDSEASISGKSIDIKDVECFKCHKKGNYSNKCPDAKGKDGKEFFKLRQLEDPSVEKKKEKLIRQIRIRHSDLNCGNYDPFLRHWIKIYDLSGQVCDPSRHGPGVRRHRCQLQYHIDPSHA